MLFAVIVAVATFTFMSLGFWQLDRLEERRLDNAIIQARSTQEPLGLSDVVDAWADVEASGQEHDYRVVTVRGLYDPDYEVLARSQTHEGQAGFHVVTPFVVLDDNAVVTAILVNQGWVPLAMDTPPLTPDDESEQTITVVLQSSQTRGSFGPTELSGDVDRIVRVDIERLQEQIPYPLYPVYGILLTDPAAPSVPVELPELSEGSHFIYAVQWFAFAAIAVVGFGALARTKGKKEQRLAKGRDAAES